MGSMKQGAWQQVAKQGAWQQQSVAYSGNLADTISLSDALTLIAGENLSDSISLTDSIVADVSAALADGISLSEALAVGLEGFLSDTISLSDQVTAEVAIALADILTLVDQLGINFQGNLSDTVTLSDVLAAIVSVNITDTLSLADSVVQDAVLSVSDVISLLDDLLPGAILADGMSLTEQLAMVASSGIGDGISITDNLTGVLSSGFVTPGTSAATTETVKAARIGNQTWRKAVTNEPSPITAFTSSSANTTFTATGVTDASAWDLSDVNVGDVAVTGDGYIGIIRTIGVNSFTIPGWIRGGVSRQGSAADMPVDGNTVTIHKMLRCKKVILRSVSGNTQDVYVGIGDPSVTSLTGHPISMVQGQQNSELVIDSPSAKFLNLGNIWVSSGTPQNLVVSVGLARVEAGIVSVALSGSLSDAISLSDNVVGVLYPAPDYLGSFFGYT